MKGRGIDSGEQEMKQRAHLLIRLHFHAFSRVSCSVMGMSVL